MAWWILLWIALFTVQIQGHTPLQIRFPETQDIDPDPSNRTACGNSTLPVPANRVNSTELLLRLRQLMVDPDVVGETIISAYIVPTDDDHQSEYVADADQRRYFISGFSGSAGTAIITLDSAALWTDGRYYLQADQQLDCNWLLMRQGMQDVPSEVGWTISQLKEGSIVAADPTVVPFDRWLSWKSSFESSGITLLPLTTNLVDLVWEETGLRPPYVSDLIEVLDLKYAGISWEDKIATLREQMSGRGASSLIITSLDEVAWTLNLRGTDVVFTPVIRAFLVVRINAAATFYVAPGRDPPDVRAHLHSDDCGPDTEQPLCVEIRQYELFYDDLLSLSADGNSRVWIPTSYSYSGAVNYAIYSQIPEASRIQAASPVVALKEKKNPVEAQGMRNCHLRDAIALCDAMSEVEEQINGGIEMDELSIVAIVDAARLRQDLNRGPSFGTIAGADANGALPHYEPSVDTNIPVTKNSVLVVDSGGQYLDGTTDVTRTFHYGTPSSFQREAYTRVLMGCIDLATLVFPPGYSIGDFEIVARGPLFRIGLDYRHGTTHGVGSFLNVHESFNDVLVENFFGSQEPGYYEESQFGVRLENVVQVIPVNTTYTSYGPRMGFEMATLFPFEPKMIDVDLLSDHQIEYLNVYNEKIRNLVGPQLVLQGLSRAYDWMMAKTVPLSRSDWKENVIKHF